MSTQKKDSDKHITTKVLYAMKQNGEKISMLTAYDFLTAKFLDAAGVGIGQDGFGFGLRIPYVLDCGVRQLEPAQRSCEAHGGALSGVEFAAVALERDHHTRRRIVLADCRRVSIGNGRRDEPAPG